MHRKAARGQGESERTRRTGKPLDEMPLLPRPFPVELLYLFILYIIALVVFLFVFARLPRMLSPSCREGERGERGEREGRGEHRHGTHLALSEYLLLETSQRHPQSTKGGSAGSGHALGRCGAKHDPPPGTEDSRWCSQGAPSRPRRGRGRRKAPDRPVLPCLWAVTYIPMTMPKTVCTKRM